MFTILIVENEGISIVFSDKAAHYVTLYEMFSFMKLKTCMVLQ